MFILMKNTVILGVTEEPCYIRSQSNGYDISCNLAKATHILYEGEKYSVQDYKMISVETVPDDLSLDGTWVLEDGILSQSALLEKEKENAQFLASLSDLALMELSARLDALEDEISEK